MIFVPLTGEDDINEELKGNGTIKQRNVAVNSTSLCKSPVYAYSKHYTKFSGIYRSCIWCSGADLQPDWQVPLGHFTDQVMSAGHPPLSLHSSIPACLPLDSVPPSPCTYLSSRPCLASTFLLRAPLLLVRFLRRLAPRPYVRDWNNLKPRDVGLKADSRLAAARL